MMTCIVVDDEKLARDLVEDNVRRVPFLTLRHTCKNALEAAGILHREQIDLVFLDVQMPELSGLEFVRTLARPPMVILISAYDQYALEAFDRNVIDYLVKPVSFERFLAAVNKAYELHTLKQLASSKEEPSNNGYFFIHVEYEMVKVDVDDVIYVEGMKDYIKIHLASAPKPVMTRMSIKVIEEKLAPYAFVRIHKSFIVSVKKITKIKRDELYLRNSVLPIGDSYKENVSRILKTTSP